MKMMAIAGKIPCSFSRRFTVYATGLSLSCLFAFGLAGCGPSNDATNATSPASTPSAAATPFVRPQTELAVSFDASTETILDLKSPGDLAKLKVLKQADFSAGADGLNVTASGNDPSLALPPFCAGKQSILQVVIDSPVETPIQVFYALRDHPETNEAQSETIPLKKGKNVVYFQLDQANLIDPLRLDPGASPGIYIIRSIVARTMAKPTAPSP